MILSGAVGFDLVEGFRCLEFLVGKSRCLGLDLGGFRYLSFCLCVSLLMSQSSMTLITPFDFSKN